MFRKSEFLELPRGSTRQLTSQTIYINNIGCYGSTTWKLESNSYSIYVFIIAIFLYFSLKQKLQYISAKKKNDVLKVNRNCLLKHNTTDDGKKLT